MKKVSTKTVENLMKSKDNNFPKTVPLTFTLDDKDVVFNIKTSLSIAERTTFISRVCNSIFFDNQYHIEYFEPLFDITLLQMFTDIPVFQDGENLNMDKTIELCKFLKIRNTISSLLTNDIGYILDLHNECKEVIEFKKQQKIAEIANKSSVSDEVILSVTGLINELKQSVAKFNPDNYKDVLPLIQKLNGLDLSEGNVVSTIVENAQNAITTQNDDKNVQNEIVNEQVDNKEVIDKIVQMEKEMPEKVIGVINKARKRAVVSPIED